MYRKLIVGFDESPTSHAALLEAAHWVRRHGGEIVLVNVSFFDTEEYGIAPEQLDKRLAAGERICTAAAREVADTFGVAVSSVIVQGEPPETLVETARAKEGDLIVIGTHGRRGLNRLFMGSVAARVIAAAPMPVLVVRRACDACRGEYRRILVPFDRSAFSAAALRQACALAHADGGAVTALYAIPRYEEMIGFVRSEGIREQIEREARKILAGATEVAAAAGATIATELADGPAADEIVAAATRLDADLIAIGSHGHRGVDKILLGSTAERVILSAPCPVLVLKEKAS
jgi:nucleotide-binding universal stress UspA family protein